MNKKFIIIGIGLIGCCIITLFYFINNSTIYINSGEANDDFISYSGKSTIVLDYNYVELLVKTGDNIDTNNATESQRGVWKQGYIVNYKPGNWSWGNLERDPKRFAIIKIPVSEFNESWLEPEYINPKNLSEGIKTRRKYTLPLDAFLSIQEISDLKNISYGEEVNYTLEKEVINVSNLIIYNNWSERPEEIKFYNFSSKK